MSRRAYNSPLTIQRKPCMDLQSLSIEELQQLQKDIQKAIESHEARSFAEARVKLEDYAREIGVRLEDVMGVAKGKRKDKAQRRPKFRHPENLSLTWTGRGRRPSWFKEALKAGMSEAQLEI